MEVKKGEASNVFGDRLLLDDSWAIVEKRLPRDVPTSGVGIMILKRNKQQCFTASTVCGSAG